MAELVRGVAAAYAALYTRTGTTPPWIGYLAWSGTGAVVGACGFKGACRSGAVEISYLTFPACERQGWGGRMAAALVEIARRRSEVERIGAHTLPQAGPSTRILERQMFTLAGPVEDPEDGTVWRWVRPARGAETPPS